MLKRNKSKALSLLVVLIMVLSVFPAFAANAVNEAMTPGRIEIVPSDGEVLLPGGRVTYATDRKSVV